MKNVKLFMTFILFLTCWIINPLIFAEIIYVPAEMPTIQEGIDMAKNGDTVLVDDGIYKGDGNVNINFKGKEIIVSSKNGAENAIIDCEEKLETRGFLFTNAETHKSILDGFTIKNGHHKYGGGIWCNGASPTIKNCNIYDTNMGAGIVVFNSDAIISDCSITGTKTGGGVAFDGEFEVMGFTLRETKPMPKLINCTISKNKLSGVSAFRFVSLEIKDCKISQNMGRGVYIISHC